MGFVAWIEHHGLWVIVMIFAASLTSISASSYISDGVFMDHIAATGRSLLQQKSGCSVNFEFQNYTIITSQCKGPSYPPKLCCDSFVEFACPFADQINDLTNECATTMFSYINIYGKYPPGLFASLCNGDKNGLECPALAPSASEEANGSLLTRSPATGLISVTFFVMLLFRLV